MATNCKIKTRIINKLRETLALEDDPIRSIKYEEQLRQAEEELKVLSRCVERLESKE